ncbi:hypothetical protein [uncultured Cellulomonas sp.]|uniref:hypothetical protein n=1 Tax=uncultured Cellulomonas sp. TaxID=189682 RepID=UPI002609AB39|nr:hypothetical protein [uncultured Cellulomonas sp.]
MAGPVDDGLTLMPMSARSGTGVRDGELARGWRIVQQVQVFYVGVINDNRPSTSEYGCGVEVLVSAESRMDATAELRKRGFTSVHKGSFKNLEDRQRAEGESLPVVAPGEVWARAVYVEGGWEKR